ncbi:hypothetical protein ES703_52785 [subsurface metagenome]
MRLNNVFNLKINSALEENVSAYADLDLKHSFGNKDLSGYILQYDEKTEMDNYLGVNLKEIYIDLSVGIFDFRLGKQIVSWGRVDAFAPTDNINPLDYRGFDILDFSSMKIGIPMLKVDAYLLYDYLHIEAIYIPYFFESVYPDPDSDWTFYQPETMEMGGLIYKVVHDPPKPTVYSPSKTLKSSEVGLRVGSSVGGYDFSGSYFFTWDDNPTAYQELTLNSPEPGDVTVTTTLKHHRSHIIGLDLARAIGELSLRAESAFFITEDPEGEDEGIADPYLKWAIGADYTFLDNYTINLQFSEEIQNLNFNTLKHVETLNSIIVSLAANFLEERLRVELGGIYEFEDEDYLVIPKLEYDFSDSLSFSFGAQIFGGDKGTQFGSYDENDALFIKAKYSF